MNSMEVPEDGVQAAEEEPNRQAVKCEVHELRYNPTQRDGCVLCLREERRKEASRRLRLVAVAVLGVALLVTAFHQATRSGDGGSSLLASASTDPSDTPEVPVGLAGESPDAPPKQLGKEPLEGDPNRASSDVERAAEVVDESIAASLQLVGNDIYHLVRVGRLESDSLGEILGDGGDDAETLKVRQRWNNWRRDWARQVQRAAKRMPSPPPMTSNINLLVAYQKMVSALSNLSMVPVSGGDEPVPYLYQRRSRFEAAEREAKEAEIRLKSLSH